MSLCITEIEREVINSLKEQDILSRNPTVDFDARLSLGQRLADGIADFGGSWVFISIFALVIIVWMVIKKRFQEKGK